MYPGGQAMRSLPASLFGLQTRKCLALLVVFLFLASTVKFYNGSRKLQVPPSTQGVKWTPNTASRKSVPSTNLTIVQIPRRNEPIFEVLTKDTILESIRGTNITIEEILANVARCRKAAKEENPECRKIPDDPRSFWRSTKTSGFSQKEDFQKMTLATSCCAYHLPELMSPPPSEKMYPWERDILSHGPLHDIRDTAWAHKSTVSLIPKKGGTQGQGYRVGDEVAFLIQIRTGRNKPRTIGGDHVRLWLNNDDLEAAVTANVEDKGDGTYLAKVTLPWEGQAVVMATIAQTRELFRSVLYVQRLFTSSYWITASFQNKKASEGTPCSPLPFVPGFLSTELCNFTGSNGGMSWYCGRPVKKDLQCTDLESNIKFHWPHKTPLTKADADLVQTTETDRPFMIPTNLVINVEKKSPASPSTMEPPSLACNKRRLETTFDEPMSTGYMYKKTWYPFACKLPQFNQEFLNKCLANTTILLLGDSNSRYQLDVLHDLTNCHHQIERKKVNWHMPLICTNDSNKMSIEFYPHKHPFFGSANEHVTQKMLTSAITKLDSIPPTGRYIIHLHHFLHAIPFHMSITENRLRLIREAVVRLLARNPSVYVVYQSVHAAYTKFKFNPHKMNIFLMDIHRRVFRGLGDRVMFFNAMDLTIATVNKDGHPPIGSEFPKIYLGHICGRGGK